MKSNRWYIFAAVCFILAMLTLAARAGTPELLKLSWRWPIDGTNSLGGMSIRDASTNMSFILVQSPALLTPVATWPVQIVIPATSITPVSNLWQFNIMRDLTFSSFFAMKVTNHLNQTVSDFSEPAPWLLTSAGVIVGLTR